MRLLKVGDILFHSGEEYEILEVVIGTDNHVFYGIDYKKDGDLWNVFAGIFDGKDVKPAGGVWVE